MVTKKKSSPLRGVPATKDKDAALDAFAAGAVQPTIAPPAPIQTVYPWEEPYVREDVMKQVLLKMPEPLYLKLKHITNYTPYNMTSFIIEKITPEIEKEIARMTGRG
ncbi:hypothetical protein C4565_05005 [Candidatus Parcubacteria bacterium]|nr:MAG: hypothetical protein C4565_05005 [Candidatus Parcubacteria bacterium]